MHRISTANTVKELVEYLRSRVSLEYGSYHHIPALGTYNYKGLNRYWSYGLNESVQEYFNKKGHLPDPIMKFILTKSSPYWLSSLLGSSEIPDARSQHRIKLALDNVGDGMLIPLFGPHNKRGYIYVGFEKPRTFFDEVFLWQVQALSQVTHVRYCNIIESLRSSIKLTNRETEVVELICFGKTNPEIGAILGISTNTVSGHVKNIFLKFDATDRVTVALRAQSVSLQ